MTYTNDRREGRTTPGKIELRSKDDLKYSVEIKPGYKVRLTDSIRPNREDLRRRGYGRKGFLKRKLKARPIFKRVDA